MTDESKDCAKIEQLVISLRYFKQDLLHIQERTLCIIRLSTLNADAITD